MAVCNHAHCFQIAVPGREQYCPEHLALYREKQCDQRTAEAAAERDKLEQFEDAATLHELKDWMRRYLL